MCENFFIEKLEMIICQYDNFVEISNNEQMKKIGNYHKLFIKLNENMNNQFFDEKKMRRSFKSTLYR